MGYFNAADWLVIIAYLVGMVALGVWFGKDQKTTRDYFLGSRNTSWWLIGFSILATETSALTIIGVPAIAYGGDIAFIQLIIGYVIARIVLAVVMVPLYLKGEIYSPYQLLGDSFGRPSRKLAGGFFLISETIGAGVRVYVASIPMKLMLGDKVLSLGTGDPILGSILIFIGLSLVYTYIGGVKAVIWTDAVQFILFMAGGIFTLFYVPTLIEGGFSAAISQAVEAGKLHWLETAFTISTPMNIWMGVIGGTFMVLSSHGADQLIVQRVLACGTVSEGRKALTLSAVLIFPLFLIFLFVGVLLWVYYQTHPIPIPIPEVQPGMAANDYIYPIFMITGVPHVLKGLLIVAILAAAMSSVSSSLSALASVSTMDFVKNMIRGERSEAFYLKLSRNSTIIWALALTAVAYLSRNIGSLLKEALALRGLTSGALLGALILVFAWRSGRSTPIFVGMIGSFFAMIYISQGTQIGWPWFTLIGTVITIVLAAITRAILPSASTAPDAPV